MYEHESLIMTGSESQYDAPNQGSVSILKALIPPTNMKLAMSDGCREDMAGKDGLSLYFSAKAETPSLLLSATDADFSCSKKRKKLSGDERIHRNRERNRLHARKTRERKKNQTAVLQSRITELLKEGEHLRQIVDERYTASSLLGLSCDSTHNREVKLVPSALICGNFYEKLLADHSWLAGDSASVKDTASQKRVRRSGKYSPQERERIRRERNRMHAKKTRDRKKFFLDISDGLIDEMESEARKLRSYLLALQIISEDDVHIAQQRDEQARLELNSYKLNGYDDESEQDNSSDSGASDVDEEDDDDDTERRDSSSSSAAATATSVKQKRNSTKLRKKRAMSHPSDEEPSVSAGSEEQEKSSEWSGSNDGSNQDSSLTGSTSRESGNDSSNNRSATSEAGESVSSSIGASTLSSSDTMSCAAFGGKAPPRHELLPQLDYQHLLHHNNHHLHQLFLLQQQQQHQRFGLGVQHPLQQLHPSHPNNFAFQQHLLQNPMLPMPQTGAMEAVSALNSLGLAENREHGMNAGSRKRSTHEPSSGKNRKRALSNCSVGETGAVKVGGGVSIDSLLYHPSMVTAPSSFSVPQSAKSLLSRNGPLSSALDTAGEFNAASNPAVAAFSAAAILYNGSKGAHPTPLPSD